MVDLPGKNRLHLLERHDLLRSKQWIVSKNKTITTERQLQEAARSSLRDDPDLRWRWRKTSEGRREEADAIVELLLDGRRVTFEVEFKLRPTARGADQLSKGAGRRPRLLIAPYLSETLVAHCRERGISCLDLNGRILLRSNGLLVDRVRQNAPTYRSTQPAPDLFSLKSSRLVRALLNQPERQWSGKDLAARTGLSGGLVSRLVRHLQDEGLVQEKERTIVLKRPDALLDAWTREDEWKRRVSVQQYSLLETDTAAIARQLPAALPKDASCIFTQWFAAGLRHAYTSASIVSAYVSALPDKAIERALQGRKVGDGGNLWLILPNDDGVFLETQKAGDFQLVSDAQIYLDLLQVGLRGPEQAEALRKWEGFGKSPA